MVKLNSKERRAITRKMVKSVVPLIERAISNGNKIVSPNRNEQVNPNGEE